MASNGFKEFEIKAKAALYQFAQESGAEMLNFYKDSWRNQGFTDKSLVKWERRKMPRLYRKGSTITKKDRSTRTINKAARKTITNDSKRAILVGQARDTRLKNSLKKKVTGLTIETNTDKVYAQVHNEGGNAGRGRKVRIPQRQYMGESETLYKKLESNFENIMLKTFNNLPSI
jgi:phage gpG-like protein